MDEGWKAGLVVTVYLQHATPAAFYAHVPSRNDLDEISEQFVESGVDVAFGGGRKFLAADRGDGKTLIDELKAKDYRVVYDLQEADAVDRGRIVGLFSEEYMPTVLNGRDENYLCDATKKALEDSDEQRRKERRLPADGRRLADRTRRRMPTTLRAFWPKRATSIGPSARRWTMPTRIRARWSS